MRLPIVTALASFLLTMWLVHTSSLHSRLTSDHEMSGPQKFHVQPVPRIGGLGILLALWLGAATWWWQDAAASRPAILLLLCGLPAFAAGIAEDLTKRVSPAQRLAATAVAAALAMHVLDAAIVRTDIPGLDWMVGFMLGSAAVTIFAVAGIANSVNIIDGLNGLASMCVMIMLTALVYVGFQVDDQLVALLGLAGIGAVLGFFVWNFPAGLIFLGDGGAYFLGFFVAELSILLLVRNPQVSPIFPLLVCFYPAFETLFSIYRRRFLKSVPPSMPDGIHLHSLIYRRVMCWAVGNHSAKALTRRNSMTSPYLWLLCLASVVPALLFWSNTLLLTLFLLLFSVFYVRLYWRIVRFKSPRWLVFRR